VVLRRYERQLGYRSILSSLAEQLAFGWRRLWTASRRYRKLPHASIVAGKLEEIRASALAQMREALRLGSILLRIPRLVSVSRE
jgi:hypothetical protein